MTDFRRTLLWVVFSMSLVLIWDAWNKHNGNPSMFGPAPTAKPVAAGASTAGTSTATQASVPASLVVVAPLSMTRSRTVTEVVAVIPLHVAVTVVLPWPEAGAAISSAGQRAKANMATCTYCGAHFTPTYSVRPGVA